MSNSTHWKNAPRGPKPSYRPGIKEKEAKAHVRQAYLLSKRPQNLLTYTDGSMLDSKVGVGVHINPNGNQLASEKTHPLGTRVEVYDVELHGIRRAADCALRIFQLTSKRRDVRIFTDNQAAIRRVPTLAPGPSQETAITVSKASHALRALNNSTTTAQRVPGHTCVPGSEAADRLAKEATKEKPPTSTKTSLAYLKPMARSRMKEGWMQWWEPMPQKWSEYMGHFRVKLPDRPMEPILHCRPTENRPRLF